MNVAVIGTGAIAWKHAQAYKNIGYKVTACTDRTEEKGRKFAEEFGAEFVATPEQLAQRADVDYLDVCTFPAYRLAAVELGAKNSKHVLVQKPMAVDLETGFQETRDVVDEEVERLHAHIDLELVAPAAELVGKAAEQGRRPDEYDRPDPDEEQHRGRDRDQPRQSRRSANHG